MSHRLLFELPCYPKFLVNVYINVHFTDISLNNLVSGGQLEVMEY